MISPHLESQKKGLQLLYRGKNRQKRKVHTLKGKLTLIDYKCQLWTTQFTYETTRDHKKLDMDYKDY